MQTSRALVVRGFRSAGQDSIVAWCLERLLGGERTEAKPSKTRTWRGQQNKEGIR